MWQISLAQEAFDAAQQGGWCGCDVGSARVGERDGYGFGAELLGIDEQQIVGGEMLVDEFWHVGDIGCVTQRVDTGADKNKQIVGQNAAREQQEVVGAFHGAELRPYAVAVVIEHSLDSHACSHRAAEDDAATDLSREIGDGADPACEAGLILSLGRNCDNNARDCTGGDVAAGDDDHAVGGVEQLFGLHTQGRVYDCGTAVLADDNLVYVALGDDVRQARDGVEVIALYGVDHDIGCRGCLAGLLERVAAEGLVFGAVVVAHMHGSRHGTGGGGISHEHGQFDKALYGEWIAHGHSCACSRAVEARHCRRRVVV